MRALYDYVYIFILILPIFTVLPCSADEQKTRRTDISSEEAVWNAVLSGAAVCAPEQTSYGFAVLTDGRMISACTGTGTVLWQKAVPGRPDPFLTVLDGDFLLTVSNGQMLSLTNPGGLTLWSVPVPFSIISAPMEGRDARIFVRGRKDISCYSIAGVCKWHLSTEEQSALPVQELPDGSLVIFLLQPAGTKTAALRISPFGDVQERITFSGIVASSAACSNGLLLTFTGGGAGMCTLKDNEVHSVWAYSSESSMFSGTGDNDRNFFLPLDSPRAVLVQTFQGKTGLTILDTAAGTVLSKLSVPDIDMTRYVYAVSSGSGILIADDKRAAFISGDGTCRWSTVLPVKNSGAQSWNYLTYTSDGFLIFCRTSWTVSGYRMMQIMQPPDKPVKKTAHPGYSSFFKPEDGGLQIDVLDLTGSLGSNLTGDGRRNDLTGGMYGSREIKWTQELLEAVYAYLSFLRSSGQANSQSPSVFSSDITGTDRMLSQLSLYGTNTFPPLIAQLISSGKNSPHMRTLLETAAACAYDPDGSLLDSLDRSLFFIQPGDDSLLFSLCNAVYSVCRFMGRPAFYAHGRDILSKLLFPQYDNRVHDYARKTLLRIAALGL